MPTEPLAVQLSVVVLCFRGGESIRVVVARIIAALTDAGIAGYELVLVGNYVEGTADPTPAVVSALAAENPRIVCSTLPKRGMMGWDMRSGLRLARGEAIAVIDGDGQVLESDLVRVYDLLRRERLDLAKTFRRERGDGALRKLISLGFNALFHVLFPGAHVRDVNAKPKVMTRAAFERLDLKSDDWFIDAEIMIQARRLGLRVGEVETAFLGLTGRRSFVNGRAVLEFLRNLVRYRRDEFRRR